MRRGRAVLLMLVLGLLAWQRLSMPGAGSAAPLPPMATEPTVARAPAAQEDATTLPAEARATLRLIRAGGPFPYDRDGVVFGNFEHHLPDRPRGYYREYTVPTPGASNRGARRLVAGGDPPDEFWYSDDHYQSFRRVEATP